MNRMSSSLLFAPLMPAVGVGVRARVGVTCTTTASSPLTLRLSDRDETRKGFGFFGGVTVIAVLLGVVGVVSLEFRF